MSRTKALFSHLQLSLLRDVSHESFVFTSSTFTFWGICLARKLRFHIFHFHFLWRDVSHEALSCTSSTVHFLRELSHEMLCLRHLPLSLFLRENVSHESFVFTSSTFRFEPGSFSDRPRSGTASSGFIFTTWPFQKIWRMSRTKASFSHLPLSLFWWMILHESFVSTSSTSQILERQSRTNASFSHLPLSDFEGCLARKLRFHIFHFHFFKASLARNANFYCVTSSKCWRWLPVGMAASRLRKRFVSWYSQSWRYWFSLFQASPCHEMRFGIFFLSILYCNSVFATRSADCIVVAASRFLGAAAMCVVLFPSFCS